MMKSFLNMLYASVGCTVVLAINCVTSYSANIAFDSAADIVYDDGWDNGDNGGSGLGPWAFNNNAGFGSAGQFLFTSTDNGDGADDGNNNGVAGDGDIDTPANNGRSWGMFANGDSSAFAIADRPLTGGELAEGQTLSVDMDNGFIDGGGQVGVFFGNGGGDGLGVFFQGGDANYSVVIGQFGTYVVTPTILAFADEGLNVTLERTGPDAGSLTVTLRDGSAQSFATSFDFLDPVTTVSLVNRNAGLNAPNNAYFNSISVTGPPIPEPMSLALVGICGLALTALRRRRL